MPMDTSALVEKWKNMSAHDRMAIQFGGGCIAGGALVALALRKPWVFAVGATFGAVLIGWHLYQYTTDPVKASAPIKYDAVTAAAMYSEFAAKRRAMAHGASTDVGAPIIDNTTAAAVGLSSGVKTLSTVSRNEYPMQNRIPDMDFWTDPLDDRIRWHTHGPIGPYVGDRGIYGFQ